MSKKLAFGSIWILAYVLCGLFLFLQKNDPVPEGFKLSGRGTLPWNESPQTLTVFQETEQLMLTILEPDFPKIIQKSEISGAKLLLRVANGNPTKIFGMLKTNGDILYHQPKWNYSFPKCGDGHSRNCGFFGKRYRNR